MLGDLHIDISSSARTDIESELPGALIPRRPSRRNGIPADKRAASHPAAQKRERYRIAGAVVRARVSGIRCADPRRFESDIGVGVLCTSRMTHNRRRQSKRCDDRPPGCPGANVDSTAARTVGPRRVHTAVNFDAATQPQTIRSGAYILVHAQGYRAAPGGRAGTVTRPVERIVGTEPNRRLRGRPVRDPAIVHPRLTVVKQIAKVSRRHGRVGFIARNRGGSLRENH